VKERVQNPETDLDLRHLQTAIEKERTKFRAFWRLPFKEFRGQPLAGKD
jgi:hypothetical protein